MRDVLDLPFVTQEQKYEYWQQSKAEIKKLRTPPPKSPAAHTHAEIITAWVNGARIQGQSPSTDEWVDVYPISGICGENADGELFLDVSPIHPDYCWWENWRIKP